MSTPSDGSKTSVADCDMEDIHALLYLEVLKRFREDEANIKRQVEEKVRQYEALRSEYVQVYEKYVRLTKLVALRTVLDKGTCLRNENLADAHNDIASIIKITGTGELRDYVPVEVLEQCKSNLANVKQHTELAQLRKEHDEIKSLVRSIQATEQTLENIVEMVTLQSLDYFVDHVQQ